jgi:hypothetical protein
MSRYRAFICGGDMRSGPRETDCPDPLHDFPLPSGYVDGSEEAASRLSRGWGSTRCRRCGLYGWTPGRPRKGEQLVRVRPSVVGEGTP